jgi:Tol biopolymer transport system component
MRTSARTNDEICIKSANGSQWRRLTSNGWCDSHGSFAAGGSKIVFQREVNNRATVWIMDAADGANQVSLTAAHAGPVVVGCGENKPVVSPDGTKIAFRSGDDDTNSIWVMSIEGLNPVRITPANYGECGKQTWSPDGQWILFNAKPNDGTNTLDMPTDLFKVRIDGSSLTSLTPTNDYYCANWAAFSPNGQTIAFHQSNRNFEPLATNQNYKLTLMNADGSGARNLVVASDYSMTEEEWDGLCGPISWSPNGQWLQFKAWDDGSDSTVICMINVATGERVQLTDGYNDYRAWWSDDGKYILFRDRSYGARDVDQYGADLLVLEMKNPELFASARILNDYDGDGLSDQAIYYAFNGTWYVRSVSGGVVLSGQQWGYKGAKPVPGDFNGDGTSDLSVYDPQNGKWYIQSRVSPSTVLAYGLQWGFQGATAVTGDYDGDGASDPAVYNAANGRWYIRTLAGSALAFGRQWGYKGALPIAGDYDGDGSCDLAVYDPQNGKWFIQSMNGAAALAFGLTWGFQGGTAVPGDYNGDGISDLAIYSRYNGTWYIKTLGGSVLAYGRSWGFAGALPVPGDYDGDGISDLGVYNPTDGKWYVSSMSGNVILFGRNWGGFKGAELIKP